MSTAAAILQFFARVLGEGHDAGVTFDVRGDGPVVPVQGGNLAAYTSASPTDVLTWRRWRKRVLLHEDLEPGRVGSLWLVGQGHVLGRDRRLFAPLVTRTVDHRGFPGGDRAGASRLAQALELDGGRLHEALASAPGPGPVPAQLRARMPRLRGLLEHLDAVGIGVDDVYVGDPHQVADRSGLQLVLADAAHIDLAPLGPPSAHRLRAWAGERVDGTAFAALYEPPERATAGTLVDAAAMPPDQPRSPLPLYPAQRDVVVAARTRPITVVSGAPGTGKSHVAVALALDAVARGESVLLATRGAAAADVLAGLLDGHPGPTPVRIGGGTTRRELADRLAEGLPPEAGRTELDRAHASEEAAARRLRAAHDDLAQLLAVAGPDEEVDELGEALLRTEVPGAFTARAGEVADLVTRVRADAGVGWWRRLRARWAERRLREALGIGGGVPLDRVLAAVELAERRRLLHAIEDAGGLDLAPVRARLAAATDDLRAAVGTRLTLATSGAPHHAGRRVVAGLAAALRAGPERRAEQLARLDAGALTEALPLWVGTVTEIEQLLPRTPAMFDLVVLDEASQLDQLVTAPVLCRARRAVITGDPRQLRHVSFVADAEVDEALAATGLENLADRLDVRRISAFDAAAAVAPVRWLDEHLRSVPHLISFSAQRFYDRHLHVVTVHPSVATRDAIDTLHVSTDSPEREVVAAEVDAVLAELERLAGADEAWTVGVLSPFRAQADALEEAVVERFDVETIRRLGLRVGTVHGFQGGERDVMLLSLGLTEAHPPQRRTFAEDPHLVNVMVTRARRRILVVTALPTGTGGLLGEYLDHAERPPRPGATREPAEAWTRALLAELRRNGHDVRPGVDRRHGVDLVVGRGREAVGVLTRPHRDGVDADVARHTALVRAGWSLVEAYATSLHDDPVGRALELRDRLPLRRAQ